MGRVENRFFQELRRHLRAAWSADTSSDPVRWTQGNPAWGQCAVTALVIQDRLGGDIVWSEARLPDGTTSSHYFNQLPGAELLDFTREQFPEGTVIPAGAPKTKGFASTRDYVLSFDATRDRYEQLRARLRSANSESLVLSR